MIYSVSSLKYNIRQYIVDSIKIELNIIDIFIKSTDCVRSDLVLILASANGATNSLFISRRKNCWRPEIFHGVYATDDSKNVKSSLQSGAASRRRRL